MSRNTSYVRVSTEWVRERAYALVDEAVVRFEGRLRDSEKVIQKEMLRPNFWQKLTGQPPGKEARSRLSAIRNLGFQSEKSLREQMVDGRLCLETGTVRTVHDTVLINRIRKLNAMAKNGEYVLLSDLDYDLLDRGFEVSRYW